jgi:hypothetical protein
MPIRWSVSRGRHVIHAEVVNENEVWHFRLISSGGIALRRRFISLASAHRYWLTICEALAYDGWR